MLISEFSKLVSFPTDTVRFYVRLGLLKPAFTEKGGRRPYAVFSPRDIVQAARIRNLQLVGYSLREIASLIEADQDQSLGPERSKALLNDQLSKLAQRRDDLEAMIAVVKARIAALDETSLATKQFTGTSSEASVKTPTGKQARRVPRDKLVDSNYPHQVALPLKKCIGKDGRKPFDLARHLSVFPILHRVADGTSMYDVFCFRDEEDARSLIKAFDGIPFYPEDRKGKRWNRPPGDIRRSPR
jgi:MerR family copper efflux transcriptional regulator